MRPSSRPARNESKKQRIDSEPLEYLSRFSTGIVYDVRLRFHAPIDSDTEQLENPQRIWKIFKAIQDDGILTKCVRVSAREATTEEILLVHSAKYHETLTSSADLSIQELKNLASTYNSIYLNNESARCARIASGGVIELCRTVYKGVVKNGFAIIRPPGHHAGPDGPMGFCLYNNIAIATKYLQEYHKAKRILIVDWDIHHGNGIQKVFLSDPNVLYFSIHRYEESKFYPYETSAAHHIVGEGEAKGKNINVPWPCSGMGDSDYLHVFNNILMPVAYEFSPEIVIIAAGFDAGAGDRVGDCLVSPAGYAHMTYMLKSLAGGKLVLALEGGYDIDVASTSALACVKVLTGEDPPALESLVPSTKCVEITQKVIQAQSKYWEALRSSSLQISYLNSEISSARLLHRETLSKERSELLMDEYGLLKLPINGSNVPDLFREEVFYSGLTNATDVVVIFIHDMNNPENFSQQESDLINGVNKFVGKVLAKNWELIDINIPSLDGFQDDDKAIVDRLFMHIWNRYIRPTSAKLVFIATGYGAVSITNLITNSDIESKESYFVMIPGTEIPNVPINKSTWYKENSYVLVHPVSIELNGSDSSYGALHPYGVRTELPLNTLKRFDQQILDQIVNWIGHR